ncbi:hypothetical protein GQX74_015176 [Glossina fuscipes]|nr:hypothetical protein GQX74_015176 [Glossina fuscipes]
MSFAFINAKDDKKIIMIVVLGRMSFKHCTLNVVRNKNVSLQAVLRRNTIESCSLRVPSTLSSSITSHITISNSCHVFVVVDTRLWEHQLHLERAQDFHIECTKDLISGLCLEFPSNSEYVVNLIRGMYTPATQRCSIARFRDMLNRQNDEADISDSKIKF